MNHFEFFGIPMRFIIDEDALRKIYYANSKKYHPDFYTLEPEEKQAEILELSTLNNQAYLTLADFDKRMKYILECKGVMADEGQNQLPQAFLAEMMDINEALMELEFDFDAGKYAQALHDADNLEEELFDEIYPVLQQFEDKAQDLGTLSAVKDFYLKKRYLLRIKENLAKFAPL